MCFRGSRCVYVALIWGLCLSTWSCLTHGGDLCEHQIITINRRGVLQSINFPFDDPANSTCNYVIWLSPEEADDNVELCFQFWRFNVFGDINCTLDYLEFAGRKRFCRTDYIGNGIFNDTEQTDIFSPHLCWPTSDGRLIITHTSSVGEGSFYATFITVNPKDDSLVSQTCIPTLSPQTTLPRLLSNSILPLDDITIGCLEHCAHGYMCDSEGTPSCDCSSNKLALCSAGEWTCFNSQCIPITSVCDMHKDCLDGSDETYTHAKCTSRTLFKLDACDFEHDTCGLLGLKAWYHISGSRSRKGPYTDHTRNSEAGHILKVKHWWNQLSDDGDEGSFQTQIFETDRSICFSMWFHLYGEDAGAIVIYLGRDVAWFDFGNHGKRWHNIRFDIPAGYVGSVKVDYLADYGSLAQFAVDDLSFLDGYCQPSDDISCVFQATLCGWLVQEGNTSSDVITSSTIEEASDGWSQLQQSGSPPNDYPQQFSPVMFRGLHYRATNATDINAMSISPVITTHPEQASCLRLMYSLAATKNVVVSVGVLQKFPPTLLEQAALHPVERGVIESVVTVYKPFQLIIMVHSGELLEELGQHTVKFTLHAVNIASGPCRYTGGVGPTPPEPVVCEEGEVSCGSYQCIPWEEACLGGSVCLDGTYDFACKIEENENTPGLEEDITSSAAPIPSSSSSTLRFTDPMNVTTPSEQPQTPDLVVEDVARFTNDHHLIVYMAIVVASIVVIALAAIGVYIHRRNRKIVHHGTEMNMRNIAPGAVGSLSVMSNNGSNMAEIDSECRNMTGGPTREGLHPVEPPRYSFIMRREKQMADDSKTSHELSASGEGPVKSCGSEGHVDETMVIWSTALSRQPPSYDTIDT